jgi:hypothetical protein
MLIPNVRHVLAAPFSEFRRSPTSPVPADTFPSLGVQVYYKLNGIVEAVEVASPAEPILFGRFLIARPFGELMRWLSGIDPDLQVDEAGLTSPRFGVGLYVPSLKLGDSQQVEGVIVFERGYYGGQIGNQ